MLFYISVIGVWYFCEMSVCLDMVGLFVNNKIYVSLVVVRKC